MFTEIKYLNLLSARLPRFKQKKEFLWNFRCPLCGDSQRNKAKARGFVFQLKGKLVYKCHNCGATMSFDKFLESQDPGLYKEYRLEKFVESQLPSVLKTSISQFGWLRIHRAGETFLSRSGHRIELLYVNNANIGHYGSEVKSFVPVC